MGKTSSRLGCLLLCRDRRTCSARPSWLFCCFGQVPTEISIFQQRFISLGSVAIRLTCPRPRVPDLVLTLLQAILLLRQGCLAHEQAAGPSDPAGGGCACRSGHSEMDLLRTTIKRPSASDRGKYRWQYFAARENEINQSSVASESGAILKAGLEGPFFFFCRTLCLSLSL